MKDLAVKIQLVINTLQALEIKATVENMNHLMGCLQTLADIREALPKEEPEIKLEVVEDESADTQ